MPFGVKRVKEFGGPKEILKYPVGLHAVKSVAVDANDFTVDLNDRTQVPAGTIMRVSATNPAQYVEYKGSGLIAGILASPLDLATRSTAGVAQGALFYHGCVFATTAIVGFTQHAAALVSATGLGAFNRFE